MTKRKLHGRKLKKRVKMKKKKRRRKVQGCQNGY